MSDLRNLDLTATDGGLKTNSLMRNPVALTAGSANNAEYFGFYVNTLGGAWSYTPIDGKVAISFTPTATTWYPIHCSSITPHANGTGFGDLGGNKVELIDQISTWTVDGTGSTAGGVFTVASGGSSDLTSASSILPVDGDDYVYTAVISSFGSASSLTISYGGVTIFDENDSAGTYTGTLTATSAAGLVVTVTTTADADFVLDSISIKRA